MLCFLVRHPNCHQLDQLHCQGSTIIPKRSPTTFCFSCLSYSSSLSRCWLLISFMYVINDINNKNVSVSVSSSQLSSASYITLSSPPIITCFIHRVELTLMQSLPPSLLSYQVWRDMSCRGHQVLRDWESDFPIVLKGQMWPTRPKAKHFHIVCVECWIIILSDTNNNSSIVCAW